MPKRFLDKTLHMPFAALFIGMRLSFGLTGRAVRFSPYWEDLEELEQNAQIVKTFHPHMSAERRERNLDGWRDAVKRSLSTAQ